MLKQTQRWTGREFNSPHLHQIPCHSVAFCGGDRDRLTVNRCVELSGASTVIARNKVKANDNFAPEMRLAA